MKRITVIFTVLFLLSSIPANAAVKKENRLWSDETVYSLMIDRFNDGDFNNDFNMNMKDPLAYNGGDFQGIMDKLDYLHNMGFTVIRLTPIFDNAPNGYDGYSVIDFYKVDEHFGTLGTFKKLVNEVHKRKMKIIIDFPANNVSPENPLMKDLGKQDFNQNNPTVKRYLADAGRWWIKQTGIDGYSLPEVNLVPLSFWDDFSKEMKQVKSDFFLMGIPAAGSSIDSKRYENAGINSIFDETYSKDLRSVFSGTDQPFTSIKSDLNSQQDSVRAVYFDNENTARFTKDIVDKRQFPGARWKTALAFIYTTPGIPVVYYGTEIALNGGEIPDNRRLMNFRAEKDLMDYITKLGGLRNELPSLTRGTMEMLYDKNGMAVYKRKYKGETAIIAVNNTKASQHVTLDSNQIESGKELRGLLEGDMVQSNQDDKYDIYIDRDMAEVYVLTEKSGINYTLLGSLVLVWVLAFLFIWKLKRR